MGKDDGAFNPNAEQVAFFLANVQGVMRRFETEVVFEESTDVATDQVRYFQSIKKPLRDADGKLQILVIANDITEVREAQLRAEASERQLSHVLQATGEGVWDWEVNSGVVRTTPVGPRCWPDRAGPTRWTSLRPCCTRTTNPMSWPH